MLSATAATAPRFLRRTSLREGEYHKNFLKLDSEIISALVSDEASQVTAQMSKVYLSLINAPAGYWEREGVLRFAGCEVEGKCATAWEQLVSLVGVASATARKAIQWMSQEGIIGYYAGKNGAGIRIFINRAASSIGSKPAPGQKKLRLVHTSDGEPRTSKNDTPFNDSFADREVSDSDFNSRAPQNGAADKTKVDKKDSETRPAAEVRPDASGEGREFSKRDAKVTPMLTIDEIVLRIRSEIEPVVESAAQRAAHREHERTREWLESKGLPKAARVAQREAYNVLRQNGVFSSKGERARADLEVGRNDYTRAEAKPLSADEIRTYAEMCLAMLETHGQAIDVTLSELSSEAGGPILAEDAPRVRAEAERMINSPGGKEQ